MGISILNFSFSIFIRYVEKKKRIETYRGISILNS